jgi:hypothetical protein
MVNLTPAEPRETDPEFRAWLLRRIEFLRILVESGAPCMIADSQFQSSDERPVTVAAFHFYDRDWIAAHRRRLAEQGQPPPTHIP